MDLDTELHAWITLSLTVGLSDDSHRRLLVAFGGPRQILAASPSELARVVPQRVATAVGRGVALEQVNRVIAWLEDRSNHILTLADATYPQALLHIPDPPPVLYVSGRVELLNAPAFAIVGSRNATQQGAAHAESFARALSDAGLTIVSGLALGIDAAAHRGGLAGAARSIAVVGTGLDVVYPARNHTLALELSQGGCIVSELPLGTAPIAANFPRRNRIISGLSRGCLVVEAALSSGSLITARLANEQGKDVFAMPGSIHSPLAKGCHKLIKQGAKLVENVEDILEELHVHTDVPVAQVIKPLAASDRFLERVGFDPCDIDTLAVRVGVSAEKLAAMLTRWEIDGVVEALPGGRFQRAC